MINGCLEYARVTLSSQLFGSLHLCAVYLSLAVNSGCSEEAALRLTDREETRRFAESREEAPSIYRQRQKEREKK